MAICNSLELLLGYDNREPSPGGTPCLHNNTSRTSQSLNCGSRSRRNTPTSPSPPSKGYHFHTGRRLIGILGYDEALYAGLPEANIASFAGTGNPFALGPIHPGETVVDIGSGAGFDSLIASRLVESLAVEATGHFNVRAYLGLEDAPGSGYDRIAYTVRISAPGATPEQIAYLRERCERSSSVGDSLARAIPLTLAFEANG